MTAEPGPERPARPLRPQLPTDAAALEPMGEAFDAALDAGLRELGLESEQAGSDVARESYERHARLLRAWGAAINLTAIREPGQIARRHVCDALSAVPLLRRQLSPGASLLDLGSGGGYPGLPLAAALPVGRVGLLDSTAKKARFLAVAGADVERTVHAGRPTTAEGLRIEAIGERAEDLAEEEDERATWDVVTARAVGSLAEVVELGLPLVDIGGFVLAWKREDERGGLSAELRGAGSIIRACGGGRPEVEVIDAGVLRGHRLVVVPKLRDTPATYPRPVAVRRAQR
jgi:16S rRNA (guanine527-N7)-methyltransferase